MYMLPNLGTAFMTQKVKPEATGTLLHGRVAGGQWRECVLGYRNVCLEWKERTLKFFMYHHKHDGIDCCRLVGS